MNLENMTDIELREALQDAERLMDKYDAIGSMIAFDRAREVYLAIEVELLLREQEGRLQVG